MSWRAAGRPAGPRTVAAGSRGSTAAGHPVPLRGQQDQGAGHDLLPPGTGAAGLWLPDRTWPAPGRLPRRAIRRACTMSEEVLEQESDQVRAFLLETSVLERLLGELCDAVTAGLVASPGTVPLRPSPARAACSVPLTVRCTPARPSSSPDALANGPVAATWSSSRPALVTAVPRGGVRTFVSHSLWRTRRILTGASAGISIFVHI